MKTVFLMAGLFVAGSLYSQQIAKSLTTSKNVFIGFYEYTPPEYKTEPTRKFPLIIFLHGLGERGNGTTELPRVTTHGVPKHIKNGHPMRFFWNGKWESFIVLSPQLSSSYSVWQTMYVEEMIKYAENNLRIDPDRIALTGMSLGGGGTWGYTTRTYENAKKLSSVSTICGTYKVADMTGIVNAKLPVWSFHANDDPTVGVSYTLNAISRINELSPTVVPKLTIWPTGGHGIWDRAYDYGYAADNPNLYEWMLAQNKSLPANRLPITDAGPDITVSTGTTVNLTGALSKDPDGRLVRHVWKKIAGPGSGIITTPVSEDGITTITGLTAGNYKYELRSIDDRAGYSSDTVEITVVNTTTPNIPPVIQTNQDEISFLTRAKLDGTASYDPDGVIVKYEWKYVDGPGQYTILNEDQPLAEVINLSEGIYKFELTATDNRGAISSGIVVIKEISSILPVKFGELVGKNTSSGNILTWTTVSEYKNKQFHVQKSTDGFSFNTIGLVEGKDTSSQIQEYKFADTKIDDGLLYYRIASEGYNGKTEYSKIVSINNSSKKNEAVNLYPIPVNELLNFSLKDNMQGKVEIEILNSSGIQFLRKQYILNNGMGEISIDTKLLQPGVYFLRYKHEAGNQGIRKFIKQ